MKNHMIDYKDKLKNSIFEIICLSAMLAVLNFAKLGEGYLPFSATLYLAVAYCRKDVYIPSLLYIALGLIGGVEVINLLYLICPVTVILITKVVANHLERQMQLWLLCLIGMASLLPSVLINQKFIINGIVSAGLIVMGAYLIGNLFFAVEKRGIATRLAIDEKAGLVVLGVLLSLGIYRINIYGFRVYYLIFAFLCLLLVLNTSFTVTASFIFAYGLGGALGMQGVQLLGGLIVIFAVVAMFANSNAWLAYSALLFADVGAGALFGCFEYFSILQVVSVAVGGLSYVLLPKKLKRKIYYTFNINDKEKNVVNKYRKQAGQKLENLSQVFYEMGLSYGESNFKTPTRDDAIKELSQNLTMSICSDCEEYQRCYYSKGGELSQVFNSVVDGAITKGKANLADISPFLTSRCVKMPRLVGEVDSLVQDYQDKVLLAKTLDSGQKMLSGQMFGIAQAIKEMSKEAGENIEFDKSKESRIREEFGYLGVQCQEISCYGNGDLKVEVTLSKRFKDLDSAQSAVSHAVGRSMILDKVSEQSESAVRLSFALTPKYQIVYGEAVAKKADSPISGDCRTCRKLEKNKVLLALCDGMGSGKKAYNESSSTLKMLESFYRAGCGDRLALSMVNNMLALKNRENFSALDLAVFDLNLGSVDFVKLGGAESFISNSEGIEIVSGTALPLGIISEVKPYIERKFIQNGDMVVMVTDGIVDTLTPKGVSLIIQRIASANPQEYCDAILAETLKRNENREGDDCSVVAARLFIA